MKATPMLLPHSIHQHPRPFWVLSNIDAATDTAQVIQLLRQYDEELRAAALAQGTSIPPQILPMINLIMNAPAALLPAPMRDDQRNVPPRTNTYLLLPRAGAIMTNPMPTSACLEQAGPWRTAATIEARGDGYLMEAIRSLARSGRGPPAATDLAHPRMVHSSLYTEAAALASIHADGATPHYHEQANLQVPLQRATPDAAPPPARNAWSRQPPSRNAEHQSQDSPNQTASPLSTSSHHSQSQHSLGSHDIRSAGTASAQQTPPLPDPPGSFNGQQDPPEDSACTREQPSTSQQHSDNWFQHFTPDTDSDEEQKEEEAMDTNPQAPNNPSPRQGHEAPGGPPTMEAIQAMTREAVEEAQRKAREEHQRDLDQIAQRNQQETQAIREELQQGSQSLRQDILTQAQLTAEQHKQQTEALNQSWTQRDRERKQEEDQRHADLLREQAANRASITE